MRLNCPKCEARYDVPGKNVPTSGREVQCSACGHTWFQTHPSLSNLHASVKDLALETETMPQESKVALAKSEPGAEISGRLDGTSSTPLSRLHPTVAEVLKEEARREVAVRAAENLEKRTESGKDKALLQTAPRFENAKSESNANPSIFFGSELAKSGGLHSQVTQVERASRDDLLPDLEEINSPPNPEKSKKRKFADKSGQLKRFSHNRMKRLGLVTGIVIVICFLLIYQFSIVISQAIPQSEQILEIYVQFVDRLRIISDQSIARAIAWLEIQAETIRGPKD